MSIRYHSELETDTEMADEAITGDGCCDFVGFYVAQRPLNSESAVVGVDTPNGYYDRHEEIAKRTGSMQSADLRFVN